MNILIKSTLKRRGTPEARIAVAPSQPRRFTARALSDVTYVAIDSDLLDVMITWDQTGTYEAADLQAQEVVLGASNKYTLPPLDRRAKFVFSSGPGLVKPGSQRTRRKQANR